MKMTWAAAAVFLMSSAAHSQQTETVRIGTVGPTSGPQTHFGKDNENGARLAIEDLNAAKLSIGGKVIKWELIAEDDAGDPKQATAVAQKLVDMKVNGVVGHSNSGTTIPTSRIYAKAGIVQVSPSATNPKYTLQGFPTAFRVIANDNALGGATGQYAVDAVHAKKVAVIDDRTAYGQGIADVFIETVKKSGVEVVSRQYTTDKAVDFSAILTAIKAAKPDAVFYGGMDAQVGPMLRQMAQLGLSVPVLGGDGTCTQEVINLAGPAVDRLICAEGGISLAKMSGGPAFKERFERTFQTPL